MNGAIAERLQGSRRVHLDSMAFIYFIEGHPDYSPLLRPLFAAIDGGSLEAITSYLTLLEVLVHPLRQGRADLVRDYTDILTNERNFKLRPLDREIAEEGAAIRAKFSSIKTPDAIQLATAVRGRADVFITNDGQFRFCTDTRIRFLVLDDLLKKKA